MIGRIRERQLLINAYESKESQFAAIYGRRRIGKTYLIRETFQNSFTFQHAGAARENTRGQLHLFRSSLMDSGHKECPVLKTWYDAFNQLKAVVAESKAGKKVIFLDEAAWMDTPKSNFLSALEHFWNNWASGRKDILLIICASATSWIINKVFRNRGGLHNRVTVKIPLAPFTLNECEQYSRSRGFKFTKYQILNLYMAMGGVALYWTLLEKQYSAVQNIDSLFFNRDAKLRGEFNELYDSLFKHPEVYKAIVIALGRQLQGMTRQELLTKTKQADNGVFTSKLEELEECGFIIKMKSFPKEKKETVYKLSDNYTIFYFKYIKDNSGMNEFWIKNHNQQSARSWSGFAFERVCLQHIDQIKKAMGISAVTTTEHTWRFTPSGGETDRQGAQIDLLINRNDGIINICEMKWSADEYAITKQYDRELINKIEVFQNEVKTRKSIYLTMITTFGLKHNAYFDSVQSEVTLEQLFNE